MPAPQEGITELSVAIGRVEEGTKNIAKTLDTTNGNLAGFQLSTQAEFSVVHGRITNVENRVTTVETTIKTNYKWTTAIMTLVVAAATILTNVLLNVL